jgi:hypothetical protein
MLTCDDPQLDLELYNAEGLGAQLDATDVMKSQSWGQIHFQFSSTMKL